MTEPTRRARFTKSDCRGHEAIVWFRRPRQNYAVVAIYHRINDRPHKALMGCLQPIAWLGNSGVTSHSGFQGTS